MCNAGLKAQNLQQQKPASETHIQQTFRKLYQLSLLNFLTRHTPQVTILHATTTN